VKIDLVLIDILAQEGMHCDVRSVQTGRHQRESASERHRASQSLRASQSVSERLGLSERHRASQSLRGDQMVRVLCIFSQNSYVVTCKAQSPKPKLGTIW
jgi:hypothetical protein